MDITLKIPSSIFDNIKAYKYIVEELQIHHIKDNYSKKHYYIVLFIVAAKE